MFVSAFPFAGVLTLSKYIYYTMLFPKCKLIIRHFYMRNLYRIQPKAENYSQKGGLILMKRRSIVKIASFTAAALAIAVGFSAKSSMEACKYKRMLEYEQARSMIDLAESVNDISQSFIKGRYASTPSLMTAVSAEIWQESQAARAALSRLPLNCAPLDNTCKFIAQAGDYAFYLMKKASSGESLSADERQSFAELSGIASQYASAITAMSAQADAGVLTYPTSDEGSPSVSGEMSSLEEDFPEYATLIYDGPLSDHIDRAVPAMTENAPEISQTDALKKLSEFSGCPREAFTVCSEQEGNLPVYCFAGVCDGERVYGEVTRQGGYILTYLRSREQIEPKLTQEEGVAKAKEIASGLGIENLQETYFWDDAGIVVANLEPVADGVTLYPDLVKIGVSLDNGTLVRFESRGYLMNHRDRKLAEPAVSEESARESLDSELSVDRASLALIPTDGGNEVLCHEFLCTAPDGGKLLIYCDAATGLQRQILILMESDSGTLTV